MHFLAYFLFTALRAKIRVIRFFSKDIVLNLAWNSLKYCVAIHRFHSRGQQLYHLSLPQANINTSNYLSLRLKC